MASELTIEERQIHDQLVDFIRTRLSDGATRDEIVNGMEGAGWTADFAAAMVDKVANVSQVSPRLENGNWLQRRWRGLKNEKYPLLGAFVGGGVMGYVGLYQIAILGAILGGGIARLLVMALAKSRDRR